MKSKFFLEKGPLQYASKKTYTSQLLNIGFLEKCARTKTLYRYLLSVKISFRMRNHQIFGKMPPTVCVKKRTFFSFLNIGFFEKCARTKTFYRYLLSVKISFKIWNNKKKRTFYSFPKNNLQFSKGEVSITR